MGELYPWPFDPAYLGEAGIVAGVIRHPELALGSHTLSTDVAAALAIAGQRSYVPYGKAPAAVTLRLHDGAIAAGAAIESVSFNPTMHPLPAAIIDLVAHGRSASDIASATLAVVPDSPVGYVQSTRDLLAAIAPTAALTVVAWA
jgi:cytidine deaminase